MGEENGSIYQLIVSLPYPRMKRGFFMSSKHEKFMSIALKYAEKGLGFTSPNPLVGAVIIKNNKIISTGYHKEYGKEHAEVNAINKCSKNNLKKSTLYINLEPCCHYGNTPSCTDAIIKSGISKVIISCKDPDNRVSGKGIKILKNAGIKIETGILKKESKKLNSIYFFNKKNKRPYIVLKAALTLDGKIATLTGDSKWISNEKCRKIVHKLRLRMSTIAIGKNTIIKDKPILNCRLKGFNNKPVNKIIFSNEKLNTDSFGNNPGKILYTDKKITSTKETFISFCNENNIDSILVEGGGKIHTWFLENNLVDKIYLFYKPSFLGSDGIPLYNGYSTQKIDQLKDFKINNIKKIKNNFLVELIKEKDLCLPVL